MISYLKYGITYKIKKNTSVANLTECLLKQVNTICLIVMQCQTVIQIAITMIDHEDDADNHVTIMMMTIIIGVTAVV